MTRDEVDRRARAWIAHAEHADSFRLRQAIFHRGWYDHGGLAAAHAEVLVTSASPVYVEAALPGSAEGKLTVLTAAV